MYPNEVLVKFPWSTDLFMTALVTFKAIGEFGIVWKPHLNVFQILSCHKVVWKAFSFFLKFVRRLNDPCGYLSVICKLRMCLDIILDVVTDINVFALKPHWKYNFEQGLHKTQELIVGGRESRHIAKAFCYCEFVKEEEPLFLHGGESDGSADFCNSAASKACWWSVSGGSSGFGYK